MPLSETVLEQIDLHVKSGVETPERTLRAFAEELYRPGELDPGLLRQAILEANTRRSEDMKQWHKVTDVDRLNQAFAAIAQRGVIAIHDAGFTQSDGYDDFLSAYKRHRNPKTVIGYCFYTRQDLEGAIQGRRLYLAFGPSDPKDERTVGVEIGRLIVDEVRKVGLHVEWKGRFEKRISLPEFDWKKR
jgi:hypothetical protein